MSSLRDRLREVIAPVTSNVRLRPDATPPPVASGFSRTSDSPETVLGGEWREGSFVVERHTPASSRCGRTTIGDLAAGLEPSAHEAALVCGGMAACAPFVFLDLETTGLSGVAGTQAFLVGSG